MRIGGGGAAACRARYHARVDTWTVVARLATALAVGGVIGLNRDLRGKPAGVRTHALVSIGSALLVLVALDAGATADGVARVIQGVVAGIGFLCAGVIIHHETKHRVQGLTTAASTWMAAGLGAGCGAGAIKPVVVALAAALLVLLAGGPIENAVARRLGRRDGAARERAPGAGPES
jgi:putative Mg2+ transporter-C (MgtC) family protein